MRVKEHPESKAEQDGRQFSFARALQCIVRTKNTRENRASTGEMNFPQWNPLKKENHGYNDYGLLFQIQDNGGSPPGE